MTDDHSFAPPPFKPDEALQRVKRDLRDMGLNEREGVFTRRAATIARVFIEEGQLHAALVERPTRSSPRWRTRKISNSAGVRDFAADLKKALAGWGDKDD